MAAAPVKVFGGAISCVIQTGGSASGQSRCGTGAFRRTDNKRSTVKSFDGVPIDANLALPNPNDSPWGDGPYPLVMMFHGYAQGKESFPAMSEWLDRGFAVFSQTNRGFHESCGTSGSKTASKPICAERGYVRLDDTRYEVRDAQHFAGMLVDEGLVIPDRIAAVGSSYGGGMSLALAALRNRIMLSDGSYEPWESPTGTPMSLAVAAPDITWSDLAYALMPNGATLDYLADNPYGSRAGVMKEGLTFGLYFNGINPAGGQGYYAPAGTDPAADLENWALATMYGGEPYGPDATAMIEELTAYHSSYYIDHSQPPAPLLISAAPTDDLFPASEALRFYNRTRSEHPESPIGLFFGPLGGGKSHPRAQDKANVRTALESKQVEWLDHYLGAGSPTPDADVTTFTQTCPDATPAAGPFVTSDWVAQSPGELRLEASDSQTVAPDGGDREVGAIFKPGEGASPCAEVTGTVESGTAAWELEPAPAAGYTVTGSPAVIADFDAPPAEDPGGNPLDGDLQIAARLVDVSPDGTRKLLVNRALWRVADSGRQVFQLNPNGWKVEAGHKLRLELLPYEGGPDGTSLLPNFSRRSNNQRPITVTNVDLRIPVREEPGALDGRVADRAPRVLPNRPGAALAPGNEEIGCVTLTDDRGSGHPCSEDLGDDDPGTDGPDRPGGLPSNPGPDPRELSVELRGKVTLKGRKLTARFHCAAPQSGAARCAPVKVVFRGTPKRKKAKGRNAKLAAGKIAVKAGKTKVVKLKLTKRARKLFRNKKKRIRKRGKVRIKRVKGLKKLRTKVMIGGKNTGFVVVKRNGKVR